MSDNGLIAAFLCDGGRCRAVGWDDIRGWKPGDGFLWVHLNQSEDGARAWLEREADLDPIIVEALLEEATRPRTLRIGDSLMVILRGVNMNPGADPEDMVSVRLWIDAWRAITIRDERVLAVQDIRHRCEEARGPLAPGDFMVSLAEGLIDRMAPVIEGLSEGLDDLEESILTAPSAEIRADLAALRRQAIALRRHIAPQRDATIRLVTETPTWMTDHDRARLRETADTITRYVEDLDALRERAAVTQEELTTRLADRMNRTMYVLSLVAAIFLPLSFVTGLLGINVAGIPGSSYHLAFFLVCIGLAAVAGLELYLFRRKNWF